MNAVDVRRFCIGEPLDTKDDMFTPGFDQGEAVAISYGLVKTQFLEDDFERTRNEAKKSACPEDQVVVAETIFRGFGGSRGRRLGCGTICRWVDLYYKCRQREE